MQKSTEKKETRTRNWCFILYPDSAPADWVEKISNLTIPWAHSPLHDMDVIADTGEIKKAHHHVILIFPSVKAFSQIKAITDDLGQPIPQACQSLKGSVRYFTHKDSADKFQYEEKDIKCFNGFDIADILKPTATENKAILREICNYIVDENIREYSDIIEYAMREKDDWFDLLSSNYTMFLTNFLRSRRHRGDVYENKSSNTATV